MLRKNKKKTERKIKVIGNDLARTLNARYPKDLLKQLWGYLNQKASDSLYRWWWEFQKASKDHPEIRAEMAADPEMLHRMQANDEAFGPLFGEFEEWWDNGGRAKFAEDGVPLISVLSDVTPNQKAEIRETGISVHLPMSIPKELILEQVAVMLEMYHLGDKLKVYEGSTATIKIYPKTRYREANYDLMIKIWRSRQQHPEFTLPRHQDPQSSSRRKIWEVPWWQIYCEATEDSELAKWLAHHPEPDREARERAAKRQQLTKVSEKLYEQADDLIRNAICGEFPKETRKRKASVEDE
jgi:hypothetical protein